MNRPSWDIYVVNGKTGEPVKAKLYEGLEQHNLDQHEQVWIPALNSHNNSLVRLGIRTGWAEDAHWQWAKKVDHTAGQMGFRNYAIEVAGLTEGLMLLKLITTQSRLEPPKELVYIDYLSVAPCNRKSINNPPRYRAIGSVLFNAAIQVSIQEEMEGRVGLHSLSGAKTWYEQIGLTDFGPDMGYQNLTYFELSKEHAKSLLDDMKD